MKEKQVIALGFFDGVHKGHGALLRACRTLADELGVGAAALTFSTHPDALVSGRAPVLINTVADREKLLREEYGMDRVILLPFDKATMSMGWETFFHMLCLRFGAVGLVCGHDFRFGRAGEGNAEKLRQICADHGLACHVVPQQLHQGVPISSTHIRTLLEQGDVEQAAQFLGHPHRVTGTVVPGRHLGRTLGIPTANLVLQEGVLVMKLGVYACRCTVDGKTYTAVTNVGTRPTVDGGRVTVEAWILDFAGDLYGKQIMLEFFSFLRPEQRFDSLEALGQQVKRDGESARRLLG